MTPPRISIYRFAATIAGLAVFFSMSCLYAFGDRNLYAHILRWYGIAPFRSPFLDISAWLAVWECARVGVDVIASNPCDVLQRSYSCSPLWIAASTIPLGVRNTTVVGYSLDLAFIWSLSLLPSPRRLSELMLVLAASLSTMVIFALERANPDVMLFLMVLATGILAEGGVLMRALGSLVALVAASLKYYPITVLVIVFRETVSMFIVLGLLILGCLAAFWAAYHEDIVRGLPSIAWGPYNTDMFGAKNLPFLLAEAVGSGAEQSVWAPMVRCAVATVLYATLLGTSLAICSRQLRFRELRDALASLPRRERLLLVIGSAVLAGCFFGGQSTGYRGVFFLLTIPGLLAISRTSCRSLRKLSLGTGVVIVLVMWGECFRRALDRVLENASVSEMLADYFKILFWFFRELGWWWTVSVMLTILIDFLWASPVAQWLWSRLRAGNGRSQLTEQAGRL